MKNDRRLALQFAAVNAASVAMPVATRLAVGLGVRYGVVRLGANVLIPVGAFAVSRPAQAFPVALIGLILGMFAGAAVAKSSLAADLSEEKAWMKRPLGVVDDFHELNGSEFIAKPKYRGTDSVGRVGIDTTNGGALALEGSSNPGRGFRKDMTEEEFKALQAFGAILPKSDRKAPAVVFGGSDFASEMWRQMHGVKATPDDNSFVREYTDFNGNVYMGARHLDRGSNRSQFWIGRVKHAPLGS